MMHFAKNPCFRRKKNNTRHTSLRQPRGQEKRRTSHDTFTSPLLAVGIIALTRIYHTRRVQSARATLTLPAMLRWEAQGGKYGSRLERHALCVSIPSHAYLAAALRSFENQRVAAGVKKNNHDEKQNCLTPLALSRSNPSQGQQ